MIALNLMLAMKQLYCSLLFAIQAYQISPKDYKGHTVIIDLGPVEKAKNISSKTDNNKSLIFKNFFDREPSKKDIENSNGFTSALSLDF